MNIIGRLTRDAEVRNLPNEKQVVNFSIATNVEKTVKLTT